MVDLGLCCACRKVTGTVSGVSPANVTRMACGCTGCQGYAHFLGGVESFLDKHRSYRVFQVAPSRVTIDKGFEHLAAVRLTPNGVVRVYASCCNSPIVNIMPPKRRGFLSVAESSVSHCASKDTLDQKLGPRLARLNVPAGTPLSGPLRDMRAVFKATRILAQVQLSGQYKDNVFFDETTQKLRVPTETLSQDVWREISETLETAFEA